MTKYCVKKPFTIFVAVIAVMVIGVVSLMRMKTDLLPDMSLPYLMIITTDPGASPEKVESEVTSPMEQALGTVTGVENITSVSAENYDYTGICRRYKYGFRDGKGYGRAQSAESAGNMRYAEYDGAFHGYDGHDVCHSQLRGKGYL